LRPLSLFEHILEAENFPPVPQLVPSTKRQAQLGNLTANHSKLITLISHFGSCALSISEKESWLRSTSLLVLVYEGIQMGVFDFDFAPQTTQVSHSETSRRIYMNVSQEGYGAMDDLLEWGLIRSLKMISKQHHLISAYQTTDAGRDYTARVDELHRVEVSRVAFGPSPYAKELVDVQFDSATCRFLITTPSGTFGQVKPVLLYFYPSKARKPHHDSLRLFSGFQHHQHRGRVVRHEPVHSAVASRAPQRASEEQQSPRRRGGGRRKL
jgi:hypothetical protein